MDDKCFDDIMSSLRAKHTALDAQKATLDAQKAALDTREASIQRREEAVVERQRALIVRETGGSIVSPRGLTNTLLQASDLSPVEASQSATSDFTASSQPYATATVVGTHEVRDMDVANASLASDNNPNATSPNMYTGIRYTPSHVQTNIPEGSIHIDTAPQSIHGPKAHSRPLDKRVFVYTGAPLLDQIDDRQPISEQTRQRLEELALEELRVKHWKGIAAECLDAGDVNGTTMALFEATKKTAGIELDQRSAVTGSTQGSALVPSQQESDEQLKASLELVKKEATALSFANEIGTDSTEDSANQFEEESDWTEAEEETDTEEGSGGASILAEAVSNNISQLLGNDASYDSKEERTTWSI